MQRIKMAEGIENCSLLQDWSTGNVVSKSTAVSH
jgi:hypothetical protein